MTPQLFSQCFENMAYHKDMHLSTLTQLPRDYSVYTLALFIIFLLIIAKIISFCTKKEQKEIFLLAISNCSTPTLSISKCPLVDTQKIEVIITTAFFLKFSIDVVSYQPHQFSVDTQCSRGIGGSLYNLACRNIPKRLYADYLQ